MNALEYASIVELVEELERRASGLALLVVTHADGGAGNIVSVTDRVKGDPFAVLGYVEALRVTAKGHFQNQVKRPLE